MDTWLIVTVKVLVLLGAEVITFGILVAWVNRCRNARMFRRWRGAVLSTLMCVTAFDAFLLWLMLRDLSVTGTAQSANSILTALESGLCMSGLTLPFALVILLGTASQLQRGGDLWLGLFDWSERFWHSPAAIVGQKEAIWEDRLF